MPIGACLVADAAKRAGYDVSMLDLMFAADPDGAVRSAIRRIRPDVIGISVRNIDNNDRRNPVFFIDELRSLMTTIRQESDAVTILGGAALSLMAEEILAEAGADAAATGDGEELFPRMLSRIAAKAPLAGLPGVVLQGTQQGGVAVDDAATLDADRLAPDYLCWIDAATYRRVLSTTPVQTKQGCPFRCVYCTYRKIEGRAFRTADPEAVAEKVDELSSRGFRDIEFVDSLFNAPLEHARQVCMAVARRRCRARLQSLELNPAFFDDGLLADMQHSGFVGYGLTVESASDRVLEGLRKGFTAAEVHAAAAVVKRYPLPCAWIFLLGGPGETRETVKETLLFAERHIRKADVAFFNVGIRIYPDTELEEIARKQGVLIEERRAMLRPVFYLSPEVESDWLQAQVRVFMANHPNAISADSLSLPFLPAIHRTAYWLGLRPPLWKYTRSIRRGLRLAGMDV